MRPNTPGSSISLTAPTYPRTTTSIDSNAVSLTSADGDTLYLATETGTVLRYTGLDSVSALTLGDSTDTLEIAAISLDTTGNLWIADTRDTNVRSYTNQGVPLDTLGGPDVFTEPGSILSLPNGDCWIADRSRNTIRIYDENGDFKRSFGSTGSDTGQFQGAWALAHDYPKGQGFLVPVLPERYYVLDRGNHRVQVFDTAGACLESFGDSSLSEPKAIAVDNSNCVFVADPGQHAIYGFNPLGSRFLTVEADDTLTPIAIATTTDNGYLYTIDQQHQTLTRHLVCHTDEGQYGGGQGRDVSPLPLPGQVELYPGYPNPAKRSMTIRYALPRLGQVRISIYDITGKHVKTLVNNRPTKPGYYNLTWNCTDKRDRRLAAGVYLCRLVVSEATWSNAEALRSITRTRKLVLSR